MVRLFGVQTPGRALVHPRVDGWLLGGIAVVAWVIVSPHALGGGLGPVRDIVAGAFTCFAAAHFLSSYHLAYGDGRAALRRNPIALVAVPAALVAVAVAIVAIANRGHDALTTALVRDLLVVVFTLTGWHYAKQAYGVVLLAAATWGIRPTKREAMVLRYGLYPVWAANLARFYGTTSPSTYRGINTSVPLVGPVMRDLVMVVAFGGLALIAVVVVRMSRRAGRVPPLGVVAPYIAAPLWLIWAPDVIAATGMLAGLHGLQYLPCVHRAEVDWARETGEADLTVLWLSLFGGVVAGGLMITVWLPSLLDNNFATAGTPGLYGSLLLVVVNLHHYAIDAVIWRSGGEHVKRIVKGPALAEGLSPTPQGALA